MDVEARIYLPEKPLENVWGYGEVTVERLFTFQVRVLKHRTLPVEPCRSGAVAVE